MPVKCTDISESPKLLGCAVTYRAGPGNEYATCPQSCPLLPLEKRGTTQIDETYTQAVVEAVPPHGIGLAYSHFPANQLPRPDGGTVINHSADTPEGAIAALELGIPAVYAAPAGDKAWPRRIHGTQFVRCPEETVPGVNCHNCGGAKGPLCWRAKRQYVIVFTGHGSRKALVGTPQRGGCYAAQGPSHIQWNHCANHKGARIVPDDQPRQLIKWAKRLPRGHMLRHHVAGDLGAIF